MTLAAIEAALQGAALAITPAIEPAWENLNFVPTPGTPYMRATTLLADPDDSEIQGQPIERGIFQIDLLFPFNGGKGPALDHAELIRTTFKRGTSLVSGGTTVTIQKTPTVAPAQRDGDRYMVPVSIRFTAPIA